MRRVLSAAARLRRDRGGATAVLFALMLGALLAGAGIAIDYGRAANRRAALQNAVDQAALAGAAAYTDAGAAATASAVAATYFATEAAAIGGLATLASPVITAAPATLRSGQSAYEVSVSVTATLSTTLLAPWRPSVRLSVHATAGNPVVTPQFSASQFGSSAIDFDEVFAYPVPMVAGKPQYAQIPPASQFYEIGSNNAAYPVPSGQTFPPLTATQPIAFALRNVTGGNYGGVGCIPPTNAYNVIFGPGGGISGTGQAQWFYSAFLALGEAPTQITNYSYGYQSYLLDLLGICLLSVYVYTSTDYPTNINCSFVMAPYTPGQSLATPPASGTCFAPGATPGVAFAAMSCQQYNGQSYAVWWNDMGGFGSDDLDYNDAYFVATCNSLAPDGTPALTRVVLLS